MSGKAVAQPERRAQEPSALPRLGCVSVPSRGSLRGDAGDGRPHAGTPPPRAAPRLPALPPRCAFGPRQRSPAAPGGTAALQRPPGATQAGGGEPSPRAGPCAPGRTAAGPGPPTLEDQALPGRSAARHGSRRGCWALTLFQGWGAVSGPSPRRDSRSCRVPGHQRMLQPERYLPAWGFCNSQGLWAV